MENEHKLGEERPVSVAGRIANIALELAFAFIIPFAGGYMFTRSVDGAFYITAPLFISYLILDIILLATKGRTGYLRFNVFK